LTSSLAVRTYEVSRPTGMVGRSLPRSIQLPNVLPKFCSIERELEAQPLQHDPRCGEQCSSSATFATVRATSSVVVCQLHTLTRIARRPRQVVPLKNASPAALIIAMTSLVLRSWSSPGDGQSP
jgi:hypothetical protein